MPNLRKDHIEYLKKRGVDTELLKSNYFSDGSDLCICYLDPEGKPYKDSKGNDYVVRRLFHVNAHNDIDALLEIHGLMEEIRQAWKSVPSLISPKKEANALGKSESITN